MITPGDRARRCRAAVLALALTSACACAEPSPAPADPRDAVASPLPIESPAIALSAAPAGGHGTVAFQSDRAGRAKLFAVDLSTRAVTALTEGRDHHDVDPAWSPDGRRLAWATTRFDGRSYHLAAAGADGTGIARLTADQAFHRGPAWAPDGAIFFSADLDGTEAVYRLAEGGRPVRVSQGPWRAFQPAASGDGTRLAYTVGDESGLHVVVHDLGTRATTRADRGEDDAAWPAWSPDGRRLAVTRVRGRTSYLQVVDLDAGTATTLAIAGMSGLREPAWAPSGDRLVAAATSVTGEGADWDLVVITLAPRAAFRLTEGAGNDTHPAWSPR